MSGTMGAPCTLHLKKRARQHWEANNKSDHLVLGFTADEEKRASRFALTERANLIPVLVDENITKQDCFDLLLSEGIALPKIYSLGYPNANCIGCVKATSPTYWNLVRETHPDIFQRRAEQSEEIGAKLVRHKGKRILLKDLPADAKGRDLKNLILNAVFSARRKYKMPKGTSGNLKGRNDKHLTHKQIKFAKEFVYNDGSKTQTECAIAAGYSKESAHVRASELLNPQKYPVVVRYIRELQAEVDRKYEVTFGRHVRKLADIRDQALEKVI